eukprot:5967044-Amphidinium_carterae.1
MQTRSRPSAALELPPWLPGIESLLDALSVKTMQLHGKLPADKSAFGYRPTFRQLGRIRAFMDHEIDFKPFAEEIWGDTDDEQDVPLVPLGNQGGKVQETGQAAAPAEAATELPEQTTAELFNSQKPRVLAVRALLEQAQLKKELDEELDEVLKAEDSEEGFHDPRDDVDEHAHPERPGVPADFEDVQEYQPSLQAELMERAAAALAKEKAGAPSSPYRDEADYDNDSDL